MDSDYVLSLALRFLVAGTVIVSISLAAERFKNPLLAGVLLMMPSLSILSFYFIGRAGGVDTVSDLALYALITLPVWLAYAVSFYLFLQHGFGLMPSIVYSFFVFLAGALSLLLLKGRLF